MRAIFGLVLVLGMGLAGFAVYMVKGFVSQTQSELVAERQRAAEAVATVEVYAVNRAIKYGETLTPEDVTLIRYAEPFLPEGTFGADSDLFPEGPNNLRVVVRPMEINEPVLAVKVTAPGEIAGITSLLDPGMSAYTISVDATSGVSGFLRPGDFVDIYWTGTIASSDGGSQSVTRLIKSAVELIAVDQTSDGNRNGASIARTVTVQATSMDVAALAQLQSSGNLSLALVGDATAQSDTENIQVDQRTLLGIEDAPVVAQAEPAPAARVCTIVKTSGTERIVEEIPCTN